MPQNTPMKRQFTTIDGRTVMSNLPQHWGGNDWTITGVDNPLPVGNYVQTESGVWIPQKGSDDGAADVRLTGSIVEVFFDKIVPSEQTNNLFVGERSSSGITGMTAIDISKYRKISIYIKNNTERPVLLRRLYFGLTADFRGDHIDNSGTNDIEIASDDYIYVTSRAENGIADYLTVELPFMGIHLFRGTEEPMSSGNFHVKLIGIK